MRVVIIDRDGVLNVDRADYIKSIAEWRSIPGSLEAIAKLNKAGVKVAVATNQSCIGKGILTHDQVHEIHAHLREELAKVNGHIDYIAMCPHAPSDGCHCRKPLPGLLHEIALHFRVSLKNVPFVGDNIRDVEAARTAGATPVLVKTGHGEQMLQMHHEDLQDVRVFPDLSAFVTEYLKSV
ncbi:MAG: D-glycero-beta-D-manno-heptose 1,7-bisphosphate 7-phosphatase [Gammaproteobacteria bacterium]|nr:D-glycero-beta-D-manno-heptose 1,7-bisphosphate 7-phosphatase [Gammaproteobacteria bacterium]